MEIHIHLQSSTIKLHGKKERVLIFPKKSVAESEHMEIFNIVNFFPLKLRITQLNNILH